MATTPPPDDDAGRRRRAEEEAGAWDERYAGDADEHRWRMWSGRTFDPADDVMPADVAARLGGDWAIEVHEVRARPGPRHDDSRHDRDVVLRARRIR